MSRKTAVFTPLTCLVFLLAHCPEAAVPLHAADRPNMVWISCEDISPHLGCYGDSQAITPNLDRLASQGTKYTFAFTCHGVCAPSRTGIITGMWPISLGANHMRSKAKLPQHVKLFPEYLREAGYYCTNNSKTDYNLVWNQKATWDESSAKAHWKNRPSPETPFFAVFNLTMTHESKVWPSGWKEVVSDVPEAQRHRAEDIRVPPLYPDTPAVREDLARLEDIITVMDQRVGELLQEIDDAGLAKDTIVIFWSDHGDGLPRAKRWTYDSGTLVPLIVKIPDQYRGAAGVASPGSTDDRMVSLIDLGPTMLALAGLPVPDHMQGIPFLGSGNESGRAFIYGARDRIDERFDMVRTVRNRTHRYIRNLMPWRAALQHISYGEQNETLKEMRRLLARGELAATSAQFFNAPRPPEELYDLENDPWELHNLAGRPEHEQILNTLRAECDRWQTEARDAHLLPEVMLDEGEQSLGNRWQILHQEGGEHRVRRLLETAKQASQLDEQTTADVADSLDEDPAARWWQLNLISHAAHPERRLQTLRAETHNAHASLRTAAAVGLARAGRISEAVEIFKPLLESDSQFVRHAAVLQVDEAGPEIIRPLRELLPTEGSEEYFRRLAEHARSQL